MFRQLGAHNRFWADEKNAQIQFRSGSNGPFYFRCGGMIATHGVDRDGQHDRAALFLDNFYDFAPLIFSAMRAHPVRKLRFMATGAFSKAAGAQ